MRVIQRSDMIDMQGGAGGERGIVRSGFRTERGENYVSEHGLATP